MNGSAMPFVGAQPVTTQRLISAWEYTRSDIPYASIRPRESARAAMIIPHAKKTVKANSRPSENPRPHSSAPMAKMKSVCASGRNLRFCFDS